MLKWIDRQLAKLSDENRRDLWIFCAGLILAIVVFNLFG